MLVKEALCAERESSPPASNEQHLISATYCLRNLSFRPLRWSNDLLLVVRIPVTERGGGNERCGGFGGGWSARH